MAPDTTLLDALRRKRIRDAKRQAALDSGAGWEAEVDLQMVRLRAAGRILSVHRNHPPWRQVGPMKDGVIPIRQLGQGAPDWDVVVPGALIRGDDKSVSSARFPLANVDRHQADSLDAWALGGGYPVLLVRTAEARWCLDWRRVSPLYHAGQASLSTADMDVCGRRFTDDWLTAWEILCRRI